MFTDFNPVYCVHTKERKLGEGPTPFAFVIQLNGKTANAVCLHKF